MLTTATEPLDTSEPSFTNATKETLLRVTSSQQKQRFMPKCKTAVRNCLSLGPQMSPTPVQGPQPESSLIHIAAGGQPVSDDVCTDEAAFICAYTPATHQTLQQSSRAGSLPLCSRKKSNIYRSGIKFNSLQACQTN